MSANIGKNPLTKAEFNDWANGTKETLNAIEERLEPLADMAATLKEIRDELRAVTKLYGYLDNRDQVFAAQLKVNLKVVDAKYHAERTAAT